MVMLYGAGFIQLGLLHTYYIKWRACSSLSLAPPAFGVRVVSRRFQFKQNSVTVHLCSCLAKNKH